MQKKWAWTLTQPKEEMLDLARLKLDQGAKGSTSPTNHADLRSFGPPFLTRSPTFHRIQVLSSATKDIFLLLFITDRV